MMPKRKRPEEKPKDQFKRFVETARAHGVEESEAEQAFTRLAPKAAAAAASRKKSSRS